MSQASEEEIRALGYSWPINRAADAACKMVGDRIDFEQTLAALEKALAFHKRDQDAIYAHASRWNVDVDDTTDRRDEVADHILRHTNAIREVEELRDVFALPADQRPRRPPPPEPTFTPPTEAEIAAVVARRRQPDRSELARMLDTYFEGPIDDAITDRLEADMRTIFTDRQAGASARIAYGNARKWDNDWHAHRGRKWVEEFAKREEDPSGEQLAAFIAATRPGYPPALWLRPAEYVGVWVQDDSLARWEILASGAFTSEEPMFASKSSWSIHHGYMDRLLLGMPIRDPAAVLIHAITPTRLELVYQYVNYALTRVS